MTNNNIKKDFYERDTMFIEYFASDDVATKERVLELINEDFQELELNEVEQKEFLKGILKGLEDYKVLQGDDIYYDNTLNIISTIEEVVKSF